MSRLTRLLTAILALTAQVAGAQSSKAWCAKLPRPANAALPAVSVKSDWYTVYRAADGVYALVDTQQWEEAIAYLVVGTKRALLFDTGIGVVPIRPVVEQLSKLPVTVLNSHTHSDHVGGNWEFATVAAMNTPYTRANMAGVPHAQIADEVAASAFCSHAPGGLDTAHFRGRPWHASQVISDGATFDLGGRTLEVIAAPGHTPDAIALIDRARGLLWTGDSYYDGPIYLFDDGTDLAAYEHSMARLAALVPHIRQLLPAHNTASVPPEALTRTLAAIRAVRSGAAKGKDVAGGQVTFVVDGITILTSKTALAQRTGARSKSLDR